MASQKRREQIARIIREEASRKILYELSDPRIGFVTVTRVTVASDLSSAKVYFSVFGDEEKKKETVNALNHAAPVVQRGLGPRLKTRLIPHLSFEFDESIEGAMHVSKLIRDARATDVDQVHGESEVEGGGDASGSSEDSGE